MSADGARWGAFFTTYVKILVKGVSSPRVPSLKNYHSSGITRLVINQMAVNKSITGPSLSIYLSLPIFIHFSSKRDN